MFRSLLAGPSIQHLFFLLLAILACNHRASAQTELRAGLEAGFGNGRLNKGLPLQQHFSAALSLGLQRKFYFFELQYRSWEIKYRNSLSIPDANGAPQTYQYRGTISSNSFHLVGGACKSIGRLYLDAKASVAWGYSGGDTVIFEGVPAGVIKPFAALKPRGIQWLGSLGAGAGFHVVDEIVLGFRYTYTGFLAPLRYRPSLQGQAYSYTIATTDRPQAHNVAFHATFLLGKLKE